MENAQIEQFVVTPANTASTRWERLIRRFDNFVLAKGLTDDTRIKAMTLDHAGETAFELSESVGVLDTDSGHIRCCERKTDCVFYTQTQHRIRYFRISVDTANVRWR